MKRTEILSPVGSFDSFYSALNADADAIYFAGESYGARKAIEKFKIEDIEMMVKISHEYKKRVFVTINTLIFDDEIESLIKYMDKLYLIGTDAFIMQDIGLINIASKRYPDIEIHISTQRNTLSLEEIKFYESIKGVTRVVLARETPIEEIKRIKENTSLEIEVFVHGAICMGYSGECLMSSLIASRSGNRGECAQLCRLKYSLKENDKIIEENKFLLSPKELNTIDYIDELINIGVDSFKIEGRAKSKEYVYYVTKIYKEKVLNPNKKISDIEKDELLRSYNRLFTKGYIFNESSNDLVNTYRPNNLGVNLGIVIDNNSSYIKIKLENELNRLDGLRILDDLKEDIGLIVDRIKLNNFYVDSARKGDVVLVESHKLPSRNLKGKKVLVTYSSKLSTFEYKKVILNNIPLDLIFEAKIGEYPSLLLKNSEIKVTGDFITLEAKSKPITTDTIKNQLSKMEDTPFCLNSCEYDVDENIFLPLAVINKLRRDLIDKVKEINCNIDRKINKNYCFDSVSVPLTNGLTIKCETLEQFNKAYRMGFRNFYISSPNLYNDIKTSYTDLNVSYYDYRIKHDYNNSFDDSVISEVGSIKKTNGFTISAYLNSTNIYSINYYFSLGANKVSLSYELDETRIKRIASLYKERFGVSPNLEIVIYEKQDLMITKYCMIRKHYNLNTNCNMCRNNNYSLIDRMNNEMNIISTNECGNRILNSKTLCLFKYIDDLKIYGIKNFVISFTNENEEEVEKVLNKYLKGEALSSKDYTYGRYLK